MQRKKLIGYQDLDKPSIQNWNYSSVKHLLQKSEELVQWIEDMAQCGLSLFFSKRKHGFDRRVVRSQEELPHAHLAPRKITEQTGIRRSSILRMVKRSSSAWKRHKWVKRLKTEEKSICRTIVYMVKERNQTSLMKIYLVRQTRCPKRSWHPLPFHGMVKPNFYLNSNDIRVNKEKELFSAIQKVVNVMIGYFLKMERHHTWHKTFLKAKLKLCFICGEEWPPSSSDVNPLDFFYLEFAKTKVYKGRSEKLFASEAELNKKIKSVWNICANDLVPIRKAIKQCLARMKAVEKKQGMLFG